MKTSARNKFHKNMHKMAYPKTYENEGKLLSTEELYERMGLKRGSRR
jgi:hypothetical protein